MSHFSRVLVPPNPNSFLDPPKGLLFYVCALQPRILLHLLQDYANGEHDYRGLPSGGFRVAL